MPEAYRIHQYNPNAEFGGQCACHPVSGSVDARGPFVEFHGTVGAPVAGRALTGYGVIVCANCICGLAEKIEPSDVGAVDVPRPLAVTRHWDNAPGAAPQILPEEVPVAGGYAIAVEPDGTEEHEEPLHEPLDDGVRDI